MKRTITILERQDNTRKLLTLSIAMSKQVNDRYHAWESLAMRYLERLSPHRIRHEDNSFNKLVRPYVLLPRGDSVGEKLMNRFIGPNDDKVYKAWKKDD